MLVHLEARFVEGVSVLIEESTSVESEVIFLAKAGRRVPVWRIEGPLFLRNFLINDIQTHISCGGRTWHVKGCVIDT